MLGQVSPALAVMRVQDAYMVDYGGEISNNLGNAGTYSGDLTGKNGIQAFLDPDKGIASYFRCKVIRDNWDFYLMKNEEKASVVQMMYGVNLAGVRWKRNSDGLVTKVVPVAKDAEGNDMYLGDPPYVESGLYFPVDRVERLKIDGRVGKDDGSGTGRTWSADDLLEHMRQMARNRFVIDKADQVKVELDVDFVMLSDTEEGKHLSRMKRLKMYDWVTVTDKNIGLIEKLQVKKIEWDAIMKRYRKISLGEIYDAKARTVSGYQIGDGSIDFDKISNSAVRKIQNEM